MPTQLIRIARNFSLIGLLLGSLSASAADVDQGTANDQPMGRPRPNPVYFADGSTLPQDNRANPADGHADANPGTASAGYSRRAQSHGTRRAAAAASRSAGRTAGRYGYSHHGQKPENANAGAPLIPVPESKNLGPAEIEVTSFHGITPALAPVTTWKKHGESPRNRENSTSA